MLKRWLNLVVTALGAAQAAAAGSSADTSLAGTQWRLLEFQSMDDRQGTTRPSEGTLCTMRLHGDGTLTMQLNGNRASRRWTARPGSSAPSGQFEFGPLAASRALCPPPSLDQVIVSQSPYVRGYLLKGGRRDFRAMKRGELHCIRVGPERYEVVDAIMFGG